MPDPFASHQPGLTSPAEGGFAVTPSDTLDLLRTTRAVYVGTAGALRVTLLSGEVVTFSGVQAGVVYPLRLARVMATGTTAGGIVGLT